MSRKPWVIMALAALVAAAGGARQDSGAAREYEAEARRLNGEIDQAEAAWDEQYRLYQDLLATARALEAGFADPEVTPGDLRALEDRYEGALEAAVRQARRTSELRRRVYDGMDRLAEVARRMESERSAVFDQPMPAGLWRVEVESADLVGLLRLEVAGTLVRGSYRLSNGRSGSVTGTWSGDRLKLTRVDAESGRDAVLDAVLDRDEQTLEGTWQRFELADGRPASGRWRGVRIGSEDEIPELGSP